MNFSNERREMALIVKELMERDNLKTVGELADRIGMPRQRLRAYARMENAPRKGFEKIAAYAGLSPSELVERLQTVRAADVIEAAQRLSVQDKERVKEALLK